MRKATNIEHILCDVYDFILSIARGDEHIKAIRFDEDDDLIITTENGLKFQDGPIGFEISCNEEELYD